MADAKKKAEYSKPASQVDLEARLESGNASDRVISTSDAYLDAKDDGEGRDYRVEGNETDAYIGVSPEYMTYANASEAPGAAPEDSPEGKVEAHVAAFHESLPPGQSYGPGDVTDEDESNEDENDTSDSADGDGSLPTPAAK